MHIYISKCPIEQRSKKANQKETRCKKLLPKDKTAKPATTTAAKSELLCCNRPRRKVANEKQVQNTSKQQCRRRKPQLLLAASKHFQTPSQLLKKNRNKPQATRRATTAYQSQHASHYYHPHTFSSPLALSPISFGTHYISLLTPQPSPTKPANRRPHHTPLQDPSSHDDIVTHHSHIPETKLRKQLSFSSNFIVRFAAVT